LIFTDHCSANQLGIARPNKQYRCSHSAGGVDSILGQFAFVGWVEPTPGFVGFLRLGGPTHMLPVLLRNAKPNSGLTPDTFSF